MNNAYEHQEKIPIGTITEVHGPVVVIYCKKLPPIRQALSAHLDNETCLFEVHQHLDKQHIRSVTLPLPNYSWLHFPF